MPGGIFDHVDRILLKGEIIVISPHNMTSTLTAVHLDDGCSAYALMDESYAASLKIPTTSTHSVYSVKMADGTTSCLTSRQTAPVVFRLGDHQERIQFLLLPALKSKVTLGLPWTRKHNPLVNWRTLTLTFGDAACFKHCSLDRPVTVQALDPLQAEALLREEARMQRIAHVQADSISTSEDLPSQVQSDKFELLDFDDFFRVCREEGGACIYAAQMDISPAFVGGKEAFVSLRPMVHSDSVIATKVYDESQIKTDKNGIPDIYKEFEPIFLHQDAPSPELPPHRPYDLGIDFQPDANGNVILPNIKKIYPMSPAEEAALSDFITKALARGWITESDSPIAAPCFYRPKPNGGLRLCIDYRALNAITKKQHYPLPLFDDLMPKLSKAKLYTHIDLPDAYHLVRIRKGDEHKTAFRCKFGGYEYRVVSFGLCNAPAAFQHFMNDIFKDMLGIIVIIYLDDILIFSENEQDHIQHVRAVLQRLQDNDLFVNPKKCSFHLDHTEFLGYIISPRGLSMDKVKVDAVTSWPTPMKARDIQVFLGFANFYRRFIPNYSQIVKPLTSLTGKDVAFQWTSAQNQAFTSLKTAFSSAPILRYFDFSKPAVVEPDASDFALGTILSQYDDSGILHPVAYHSRQFTKAELNYDTFDKELLAIVESFKVWRHYLIAATTDRPTKVLSDHANLQHFLTKQQLSRRQYRWAETLSPFEFRIFHRPGRDSGKPDSLSRRPDYQANDSDGLFRTNYLQLFQRLDVDSLTSTVLVSDDEFLQRLRTSIQSSTVYSEFCEGQHTQFKLDEGLLYFKDLLIVSDLDLQLEIFTRRHCAATAGHYGFEKTLELVTRDFYFFPNTRKILRRMIHNCDVCKRAKSDRHAPYGKLMPLPVPDMPFHDVSSDFMTGLPTSQGYDALYVVKDRLTKMIHLIPTTSTVTAEETARLFIHHVFKHHGFPKRLVSDRGPQFTAAFFREFFQLLHANVNLSSAYHPESDGSTEVANSTIEQYIRIYCNYQQDNWTDLLPLAEFTYNNTVNSTTGFSPFKALYGYDPIFDTTILRSNTLTSSAEQRVLTLHRVREDLQANLRHAQQMYAKAADKHRLPTPKLKIGDLVYLRTGNLATTRPSKKFSDKKIGPFSIIRKINDVAFALKLPVDYKIHNVFHVSQLEPHTTDIIPEMQRPPAPPPDLIDGVEEYEVESILDSKISHRRLRYLVQYAGRGAFWQDASNLTHCDDLLHDFHTKYPTKPRSFPTAAPRVRSKRGG